MARGKQISPQTWALHESEIRKLHSSMTLKDLVRTMEEEHDFSASAQQYTYQFKKWGLQKYGSRKVSLNAALLFPSFNETPQSAESSVEGDSIDTPVGMKRSRTIEGSSCRSSTDLSNLEMAEKRLKTSDCRNPSPTVGPSEDAVPDPPLPEHSLGREAMRPFPAQGSHRIPPEPTSEEGASTPGLEDRAMNRRPELPGVVAGSVSDVQMTYRDQIDDGMSSSLSNNTNDGFGLDDHCGTDVSSLHAMDGTSSISSNSDSLPGVTIDTAEDTQVPPSLEAALKIAKNFTEFRKKGAFYLLRDRDQALFQETADFLDAASYDEGACNLYALLLLIEEAKAPEHLEIITPLLVSCARSARSQSQCRLVQEILSKRLKRTEDDSARSTKRFLAYILLARTHALQGEFRETRDQLEKAWCHVPHSNQYVYSPPDTALHTFPPLDTLAYLYHGRLSLISLAANNELQPSPPVIPKLVSYGGLEIFITTLRRLNWTFRGLGPCPSGRHMSDYVRSCITWCLDILIPSDAPHCLFPSGWGKPEPDPLVLQEKQTIITNLFFRLYGARREITKSEGQSPFWVHYSHEELGISASVLLRICCELIAEDGFENVLRQGHEALASRYLQRLYERTIIIPHLDKYLEFQQLDLPPKQSVLQKLRPQARQHLLLTRSRELTMASSLRSSDTSFKRMKEAASSMWQRATSRIWSDCDLPSNALHDTRNSLPFSVISHLSDRMEKTLSLNRSSHTSDTQRNRLASINSSA
ncbi:clr5 domain-containing protein [Seiridium cupressi]